MATRISTGQIYDQAQSAIVEARAKEAKSARHVSSQKSLTRPSEDPQAWRIAKEMRDEAAVREVFNKNANVAMNYLTATEKILEHVQESVIRSYELTIQASDLVGGGHDQSYTNGIRAEIGELYESMISQLNTRYGSRTLLGGFKTEGAAFTKDGQYLGDDGVIKVELEKGRDFEINLPGRHAIFGTNPEMAPKKGGVNILKSMQDVITGLDRNDKTLVQSGIDTLKRSVDQLSMARAHIGSRMAGIQNAITTNEDSTVALLDLASQMDEVDIAKVFSDFARDQTALSATLSTSEKLMKEVPPDLLFR